MITAMTFLMILALASLLLGLTTLHAVRHDGRGPQRLPSSHHDDSRFRAPPAR